MERIAPGFFSSITKQRVTLHPAPNRRHFRKYPRSASARSFRSVGNTSLLLLP
jgi:hypothetical protein